MAARPWYHGEGAAGNKKPVATDQNACKFWTLIVHPKVDGTAKPIVDAHINLDFEGVKGWSKIAIQDNI